MKKIREGDYVVFEYQGRKMTGLVREVLKNQNNISYKIVPNAIGLDHCPVIEEAKVEKA